MTIQLKLLYVNPDKKVAEDQLTGKVPDWQAQGRRILGTKKKKKVDK